jgi:hypothetical protein
LLYFARANRVLAQVPGSLNHGRELNVRPDHRFKASVFEVNASVPDHHCVIRALGEVNGFRGHLLGQTKQICRPLLSDVRLKAQP